MTDATSLAPVLCIVGARPNYMKMAPILRAFDEHAPAIPWVLVHTGQHYDHAMNERLFSGLRLPTPQHNLEVGSGTHAVQTAEIMKRFEPLVDDIKPSCVLVVGDVNSTLACALVAVKKHIAVVHVEAGLRSGDRAMPEEINRILVDRISDRLYTTERSALANLTGEGVDASWVHFAGNVMIDSLLSSRSLAVPPAATLTEHGIDPALIADGCYGVVTLHRPSNVDDPEQLKRLAGMLAKAAERLPLVFAIHPRTRSNLERFGLGALLDNPRIALLPPLGYLEMLGLMDGATVMITDSGGLQEETTALSVPCITLRENTERPITAEQGTNTVVGSDETLFARCLDDTLATGGKRGRVPEYWDGAAAPRIAADLYAWLQARAAP
ncbi:non-hydrolyzing UDP-N-acetylglucosamine 2-epimerase [Methyloversatilis sp.]|uniref:non-hydrolyzing UDP-N-acetylglucosamine 2-epimerase n=1 Tax=Methyloversatilis sp. TaxID=2569862 RepID=UPI0027373843|nr:UDP-N-acetylglucosamine 2-epimerase (non-hydrolyzing) [Methyloversatilis sp.]MDP2867669.1 UDP-N-acetylglucosamine 2-epimerase (non-hydrolyzing) [Methyloversatilis sp.]MDP3288352.1 UDP-N-acetylglucosamine 2-epimerase (non-hydrolyzing) [Methyloversatilis sp.]MDP3456675.1 UDP-N-acetylglucosamine 2-epimerase (non-hydrolyzing) [Methyloversatilis sp.]MDP3577233.1 UDP-N-acetylglucosamine 2-epimerase (non-hydrolyzing) [Methyloversatilis sp.]